MQRFISLILLLAACFSSPKAEAQSTPTLTLTPLVTSGLNDPLDVVRPPADTQRLFLVEKSGRVKIYQNGALKPDSFLKISGLIVTGGEQGLLSLAFHPQYATNRFFYVLYNNTAGDLALARYQTMASNPDVADSSSGVVVLTIPHPNNSNHNGGKLNFGADGMLYWSTGDGGGAGDVPNNAQNKGVRLGKMLRLNVNTSNAPPFYSAPTNNPFVGQAGADSLIYQFGLRNPFRWSFDRLTGDMWIGDVGQNAWEEVDYSPAASAAGRDWGWRCREGAHVFNNNPPCGPNFTDPVFEYDQSAAGGVAVTGGYVYRGSLYPALYGRYVCADFATGNAWILTPNLAGTFTSTPQPGLQTQLAGFGENHRGELFAVGLNGRLYAVGATGGTPIGIEELKNNAGLRISPQPVATGTPLRVESQRSLRSAAVSDVQGRTVFHTKLDIRASMHHISLPTLPTGVYLLWCEDVDGKKISKRITVR